jgi:hypothetical protein
MLIVRTTKQMDKQQLQQQQQQHPVNAAGSATGVPTQEETT